MVTAVQAEEVRVHGLSLNAMINAIELDAKVQWVKTVAKGTTLLITFYQSTSTFRVAIIADLVKLRNHLARYYLQLARTIDPRADQPTVVLKKIDVT